MTKPLLLEFYDRVSGEQVTLDYFYDKIHVRVEKDNEFITLLGIVYCKRFF